MQTWIIFYLSIAFGLKEECCACGEVEGEFVFEGSMGRRGLNKRGAGKHGVAGNFVKEADKLKKLR